jgi:hypothetical protein
MMGGGVVTIGGASSCTTTSGKGAVKGGGGLEAIIRDWKVDEGGGRVRILIKDEDIPNEKEGGVRYT